MLATGLSSRPLDAVGRGIGSDWGTACETNPPSCPRPCLFTSQHPSKLTCVCFFFLNWNGSVVLPTGPQPLSPVVCCFLALTAEALLGVGLA